MITADMPADEVSRQAQDLLADGAEHGLAAARELWERWWARLVPEESSAG
ncbi:hypothetical protein [Kitasatospora sp. NPDC002040]